MTLLLLRAIQSRTLAFFLRVLKSFTPCNELCTPCNTMNCPYNVIAVNQLTRDGFNLLAHKEFGGSSVVCSTFAAGTEPLEIHASSLCGIVDNECFRDVVPGFLGTCDSLAKHPL